MSKEASTITKILAGPHLEDIERIASALDVSRATVIRSIIDGWFVEHPEYVSAVEIGRKRALIVRLYAIAKALKAPVMKDDQSLWPSFPLDGDPKRQTTTRIPSPSSPDLDEDLRAIELPYLEGLLATLELLYREKTGSEPVAV